MSACILFNARKLTPTVVFLVRQWVDTAVRSFKVLLGNCSQWPNRDRYIPNHLSLDLAVPAPLGLSPT